MDNIRLYTCIVGKKPTHANFFVNEVSEVEAVVAKMAGTDGAAVGRQGSAVAGGAQPDARSEVLAG